MNYDAENWNSVSNLLKGNFTELNSLTRTQIIDDAFNLARHGYIHYSLLFDLLTNWKTEETDYFPWHIVLQNLEFIYRNSVDLPSFRSVKVSPSILHCIPAGLNGIKSHSSSGLYNQPYHTAISANRSITDTRKVRSTEKTNQSLGLRIRHHLLHRKYEKIVHQPD